MVIAASDGQWVVSDDFGPAPLPWRPSGSAVQQRYWSIACASGDYDWSGRPGRA